jgi:ABC-type polysaccharide/polyol phosphate export permease
MRDVLLSNPVAQVITLFRTGFYGSSGSDGLDIGFLAICTAVALGVGMVTFTLIDVARVREK